MKCHEAENRAWSGSHHDRAMEEPTPESVKGDFSGARVTHSGEVVELSKVGERYVAIVTRKGESARTLPIKYTFGIEPLQQYLVNVGQGRLQALTVAWDARPKAAGGQRWFHLHADEKVAKGSRLHWEGPAYNWNSMCADCHSTGVEQNYRRATDSYETKYAEIDVSCEACHGKGSRHVAWAEASPKERELDSERGFLASIVRPKERRWEFSGTATIASLHGAMPNTRELDACGPCHSRRSDLGPGDGERPSDRYRLALLEDRLYFADGQILEEDFELGSFLQSKMHARGVVCSDCHEPHSLKLRAEGNALCASCHRASHLRRARSPLPRGGHARRTVRQLPHARDHLHARRPPARPPLRRPAAGPEREARRAGRLHRLPHGKEGGLGGRGDCEAATGNARSPPLRGSLVPRAQRSARRDESAAGAASERRRLHRS